MIFKEEFKTGVKDIEKGGGISNRAILEILENIACNHSETVGLGPLDVNKTNTTWILLEWSVKVIKRPAYGQKLEVETWAAMFTKTYTYRDYEIYDKEGNTLVIATSKWVLVDANTRKILKITEEIKDKYKLEEKHVFENQEVEKIEEPLEFIEEKEYQVKRRDIDINKHMHNIYYLDLADETMPEEVYENRPYNNFRISYKTGIKLGETVICKYGKRDNKHIIKIENQEGKTSALISIW